VNLPAHHNRLWSLQDNPIWYLWSHFDDARRGKHALMNTWPFEKAFA
jgi:hypothetical protein